MAVQNAGSPQTSQGTPIGNDAVVQATIQFGTVQTDDDSGLYNASNLDTNIWTDYKVECRYETDKHVWMMPVTSPAGFNGSQAGFCKLAADTLLYIADWTAERVGSPPLIPTAEPGDPNLVLLDVHYDTGMLRLEADGVSVVYRVSGTYTYGVKDPAAALITFGRPPWMSPTVGNVFPQANMVGGILQTDAAETGPDVSPDQ